MNCGKKLPDEAQFCYQCGTPLGSVSPFGAKGNSSNNPSLIQYETMLKCPNCGSSIGRLDAACPYCGSQIAKREASSTVRKFAEELSRIEAEAVERVEKVEKEETRPTGFWSSLTTSDSALDDVVETWFEKNIERAYGSKTFERKISLINAFPIPNTVEEITEFILLAIANIDVKYGKKSKKNTARGRPGTMYYTDIKLATTWVNKLEQAYSKAKLSFPNHPTFPKIRSIYENKMRELDRL